MVRLAADMQPYVRVSTFTMVKIRKATQVHGHTHTHRHTLHERHLAKGLDFQRSLVLDSSAPEGLRT